MQVHATQTEVLGPTASVSSSNVLEIQNPDLLNEKYLDIYKAHLRVTNMDNS